MIYLLDTNACIRLLNGRSPALTQKLQAMNPGDIRLCSVVQAELVYGAHKSQFPQKNLALLDQFFQQFRSVPFDESAVEAYGRIRAGLEKQGKPIGPLDMLIAAIALAHRLVLVTHNVREFSRVPDLHLEDWEALPGL